MKEKINLNNAKIVMSAGFTSQIPKDKPHIVFSGRSNVGKSSCINLIVNHSKLARVSSSPGKTITINFYDIDGKFYLVDLPGYGFAKRSEEEKRKWSSLTEGYFKLKDFEIKNIFQLVDIRIGPTADDEMMLDYMNSLSLPYTIVMTKSDKPNKTEREASLKKISENPHIREDTEKIAFSALKKEGCGELRSVIYSLF